MSLRKHLMIGIISAFAVVLLIAAISLMSVDKKIIEPHILNTSNSSKDSADFQELSNEESANIASSNEPILLDGENMSEYSPEFTLNSFTWIYIRDINNKNPKPLFNWGNVPGKDSDILRDYIIKWNNDYQWVDKAPLVKTDEFKFGWEGK